MDLIFQGVRVECVDGNIADQQDIKAVVNAANSHLRSGGGVAGALHRAAGPGLEKECRLLAPIRPGDAVITGAYNLPNKYVIHCLGPVYGVDHPEDKLLADCYRNALKLAEKSFIESIAFPSISTGIFGYPAVEAARVACQTIKQEILLLNSIKLIRFVLYGQDAYALNRDILLEIFNATKR